MKKSILFICVMCLFSVLAVPCSAAEIPQEQATVYAKCIDNSYTGLGTKVQEGNASVTTDDGITIAVSGVNASEPLKLIVMPITEQTDGFEWFKQVLAKQADEIMPFDLYLVNQNGDKIAVNAPFTVRITAPKGYAKPEAHLIGTDGSTTNMNGKLENGNITFAASGNGYYTIINRKAGATTPPQVTPPQTEVPGQGAPQGTQTQSPKTGEGNVMACVLLLMATVAFGGLLAMRQVKEKGNKEVKRS